MITLVDCQLMFYNEIEMYKGRFMEEIEGILKDFTEKWNTEITKLSSYYSISDKFLHKYINDLKKSKELGLCDVSQRRELLKAWEIHKDESHYNRFEVVIESDMDDFFNL